MMERIKLNEEKFNKIKKSFEKLEREFDGFEKLENEFNDLNFYYGSSEWFSDKEAFEKGKIKYVNAGVLSEDTIWNLNEDIKDFVIRVNDFYSKLLNNERCDCMENIIYRCAVKEDIKSINNLFIELIETVNKRMIRENIKPYDELLNGYEDGYLDTFFDNDERIIFVAEDDKKIIGYLSLCIYKELNYIYLDDYSVSEKYRGRGIGSNLLNMAIEYANKLNIDNLKTHVESANLESRKFYKKKGFELVEKQENRLLISMKIK